MQFLTELDMQRRMVGVESREPDIPPDYFRFMTKVLADLGVPGAESLSIDQIKSIPDAKVNSYLEQAYGTKMAVSLSSFEKKMIYLTLTKGTA